MTIPLLATKLYIPLVPHQAVQRPGLVDRLEEGLHHSRRLTLVTASPGYGKTSLAAGWAAVQRDPAGPQFCWLTLDESDNDPAQFWTYLLAALQTGQAGLGAGLAQAVWAQPNPAVVKLFLIGLVNEIAGLAGRLVLVLDDFHLIQNEAILTGLTFLVEHLPAQLHLALLSRTVPALPLPRWRARDQVTWLQQTDLSFSPAETAAFLGARIAGLSTADVQTIHQRLEGWPGGLQLTALALGGRASDEAAPGEDPLSTRDRVLARLARVQPLLLDYLADEVLNGLPEPVQAFLLRTSILERFCQPLCAALLAAVPGAVPDAAPGAAAAQPAVLDRLEKQNLFLIPLDPERKWFCYQRLFGQLLQARLAAQVPAAEIQALHRAAAAWHQAQGFGQAAIRHALAGGDLQLALDWVEGLAPDLLHTGRINAFLDLLAGFPAAALAGRPRLSLYHARALVFTGQYAAAWERIAAVEAQARGGGDPSLAAGLATLKALLATFTRPPDEAISYAREALSALPAADLAARAQMHLILGAMHRLEARLPAAAGEILAAQRLAQQARHAHLENTCLENLAAVRIQAGDYPGAEKILSAALSSGQGVGFGRVCLALIQLEWDRLDTAEAYLMEGLRQGEQSGVIDVLVNGYLCLAQLRWAQGDRRAAVEALNLAGELAQASPGSLWGPQVAIERRWLQVRLREAPELARLLGEAEGAGDPHQPLPRYLRLIGGVVAARERLAAQERPAEGDLQAVLAQAQALEAECQAAGLARLVVDCILLQALLFQAAGDLPRAQAEMARAVRAAAPDRLLRVFVNEGEPARRMLAGCASLVTPEDAAWIEAILAHFPVEGETSASSGRAGVQAGGLVERLEPPKRPELVEPLTTRELEVLRLIAAGHTNREIASRLVTTENTVKKHTSHIFGKLGVSNRTLALVKARELGLIA